MQWNANQLRLTAFPTPSAVIAAPDWWRQVTGQPADQTVQNTKQSVFEATGAFADGTLALRIQPLRVDWVYTAPEGPATVREVIGPLEPAIDRFVIPMGRWFELADCPDLIRLAVGSVLLVPVDSRQSGYRKLAQFLPAVQVDEDSSDFLYQINRPRRSEAIHELTVNRLSKWSVGKFQAIVASETGIAVSEPSFTCRLETDINSSPEHVQPFLRPDVPRLLKEFIDLTVEMAERGDVA